MVGTYNKIRGLLQQGLVASAASKPAPGESTVPQTMLDFLVQLVPYLPDIDTATALLKLVLGQDILQNKDPAVQKKAYRVLLRFCGSGNVHAEQAIQQNLENLVEELVEKNANVAASAKKDRTTLLATIIPLLPADKLHIIPSIIPEAVLATKEANETARGAAYDLLVGMAQKMEKGGTIKRSLIKGADGDEEEEDTGMVEEAEANLQEYVTMVAAGLAGSSPHMISATITALSRLLFEYHGELAGRLFSIRADIEGRTTTV
jgi:ribosomal RNA-processing protein 12